MESLRFAFLTDPHIPLHDADAVEWAIQQVIKHDPHVLIHGGDGHEANSASRWSNEYKHTLKEEYEQHNEYLANLRKAAPNARLVYLEGNHDANIEAINRIQEDVRDLVKPTVHEPELEHWQKIPYIYCRTRGVFRIGQVTFAHGYEANASADEFHSITLGVPFGLYVGGHTHRPIPVTQVLKTRTLPLPYWYCNGGCLCGLKPPYVERKRTLLWGQAVVLGEAMPLKSPRMTRCWDARVEIFRMYDQWAESK